ncbi:hypothetical protein EVAR_58081_1 [Eumeta japonica]|uniref:Uncharacterized protein n=1 Tax=Eumeta variegata TaxID=151549 RepID=A0A4C1ZAE4_EUMVA|nr:hypothetical protein EVAR_58081_1 [Eumeta japonica]
MLRFPPANSYHAYCNIGNTLKGNTHSLAFGIVTVNPAFVTCNQIVRSILVTTGKSLHHFAASIDTTEFLRDDHFFISLYCEPHSADIVFGRHQRTTFITQIVSQISVTTFEFVKPVTNRGKGWSSIIKGLAKFVHVDAICVQNLCRLIYLGEPSQANGRVRAARAVSLMSLARAHLAALNARLDNGAEHSNEQRRHTLMLSLLAAGAPEMCS